MEKIRRLLKPPAEEVLDVIFPHPYRQEWVANWGLTGGEVDIMLGADMIHLFPKLDHTVKKLSLYMSFLTERYIVMGQMPPRHRRSSWRSSDNSQRSTAVDDYLAPLYPGPGV